MNKKFSSLSISKEMLNNLNELGFKEMTPVQAESLPHILQNRDVVVQAKTGSGKTLAFGLGVLNRLNVKNFRVQSLVLCPTRELADQVAKELRKLARFQHNIKILVLCGGMPFGSQLGSLRHGAHIVVGTPGRVLKHLGKSTLSLENIETFVLDEADKMLDMGFSEDIEKVISYIKNKPQTLLFSATYPDEILKLSRSIQNDATSIKTVSYDSENKIVEHFYNAQVDEKVPSLLKLISKHRPETTIVFCNTKVKTEEISDALLEAGVDAIAIHGDLEQYERVDALTQFSNRSCSVLVATDVAARGIDIKDLAMVVNFDVPHDESIYTHRIGRTGRAGEVGLAVTLYNNYEAREIEFYRNETRLFESLEELHRVKDFQIKPLNMTLVIEGGKKDKVRAGDILGALTGDAGLEGKHIGKIDIHDRQSYVAVNRSFIDEAHDKLKNGKIKGRKFSVWILK